MAKQEKIEGAQFVRFYGPVLDALRGLGGSGTPDEVVARVATDLELSDEIQNELLPSGDSRFRNQVAWARFYLVREGFVDSSRRGVWSLTERGRHATLTLEQSRAIFLKWVKFFQEQRKSKGKKPALPGETVVPLVDDESEDHRTTVLKHLMSLPSQGFEQFCQRMLREAGFSQVVVTGRSNDHGIDGHGTLTLNPLVSFKVLFQCKRYKDTVSPAQVRDFRGAMAGRADKGIIITTGSFTAEARREAARDGVPPIELLDGEKLVALLEQLELGLKPIKAFEVDAGFFRSFAA